MPLLLAACCNSSSVEKVRWETSPVHLVCSEGQFLPLLLGAVVVNAAEAVEFLAGGAEAGDETRASHSVVD